MASKTATSLPDVNSLDRVQQGEEGAGCWRRGFIRPRFRVEARHQRGLIGGFFFSLGRRVGEGMGSNFAGRTNLQISEIFCRSMQRCVTRCVILRVAGPF